MLNDTKLYGKYGSFFCLLLTNGIYSKNVIIQCVCMEYSKQSLTISFKVFDKLSLANYDHVSLTKYGILINLKSLKRENKNSNHNLPG